MATTAIEKQKINLKTFFEDPNRQAQISKVLPNVGLTAERLVEVLFNAISATPKLLECQPLTLFKCLVQCAAIGLEPNTALGHAYLVPYKGNVQLIIGYKGFLELSMRSGKIRNLSSRCVYKDDDFEYFMGSEEKLHHVPKVGADHSNEAITHVYAVAFFKEGGSTFEVMTIDEVKAIRQRSQAKNNGPWVTDFSQMCRKTVIRRLMNYLPLSIETKMAVEFDSSNDAGKKDLTPLAGMIDAEYTEAPAEEQKKNATLAEMALGTEKIDCPNGFTPESIADCDACNKREGCPTYDK